MTDAIAPQTLAALREELAAAEARLRARYEAHASAVPLLNGRTRQVDRLLVCLWQCAQMPETAALAAVGGYGRCELYPASDVDLLILLPEEPADDDGQEARITAFTNALWDVGLKIGHSVRTPLQAQEAAAEDLTIQTALLEARLLCGNAALFDEFSTLQAQARDAAACIAGALEYVGTLAVEFFVSDGKLYVNEMAPRPHNSGHYTLDACNVSQYEQQVRALAGLPLARVRCHCASVMVNLLGECWQDGGPDWTTLYDTQGVHVHDYGKKSARRGRKMAHFTVTGEDVEAVYSRALAVRKKVVVL